MIDFGPWIALLGDSWSTRNAVCFVHRRMRT